MVEDITQVNFDPQTTSFPPGDAEDSKKKGVLEQELELSKKFSGMSFSAKVYKNEAIVFKNWLRDQICDFFDNSVTKKLVLSTVPRTEYISKLGFNICFNN
jgi:hypothetical protein